MRFTQIWKELTERKLVQWAVGYLAGAWVILEFADFLRDAFNWPATVLRVLTVVFAFGFFAAVVVAWFHGEKGHQRMGITEMLLLAIIAVAGGAVSWRVGTTPPAPATAGSSGSGNPSGVATPVADRPRTGLPSSDRAIAVLPFRNIGGEAEDEFFSDGITEDIISRLSRVRGLRVISRTSVMQYRDTEKNLRQIGQELGVDVILEGSVQRTPDKVRVVARLVDAHTDETLWSDTYNRDLKDILVIQSDVAERIAERLKATFPARRLAGLGGDTTVDPEAYTLYLRGRHLANSRSAADVERAAQLFEAAIARDSSLAAAWTALAENFTPAGAGALVNTPESLDSARVTETIRKALARLPDAPELHTALLVRRAVVDRDFAGAQVAAQKAVDANPNYAAAHHWNGVLLVRNGQTDAGIEELRAAQSLDPLSNAVAVDLGEALYAAGRYPEAITQLQQALVRDSTLTTARLDLGLAYLAQGDSGEAVAQLERAHRAAPSNSIIDGYRGYVLARTGQVAAARRILAALQERSDRQRVPPSAIAQVYAGLGDTDRALEWLQRAVSQRTSLVLSPRFEQSFAGLRTDPRFQAILEQAKGSRTPTPSPTGRPPG